MSKQHLWFFTLSVLCCFALPATAQPCNDRDLAEPFGIIDFFDLLVFQEDSEQNECPPGADNCTSCNAFDLAGPLGVVNGLDVMAFASQLANGCPHVVIGACCDGTTAVCQPELLTESDCLAASPTNVFTAGASCSDTISPCRERGACCIGDELCEITAPEDCLASLFTLDATCEEADCDFSSIGGACCLIGGSCFETDELDCIEISGVFRGVFTLCDVDKEGGLICDVTTDGACCIETICIEFNQSLCLNNEGTFSGAGTSCDSVPNPCDPDASDVGGCCSGESCSIELRQVCDDQLGGEFFGADTTCADQTCPEPMPGACCFYRTNDCSDNIEQEQCIAEGGVFNGENTICANINCGALPNPRGACCLFSGCEVRTEENCTNSFGTFFGVGIECAPNLCEGACCSFDGLCLDDIEFADCTNAFFQGAGTNCLEDLCPQISSGACCSVADGTCEEVSSINCLIDDYQGDGTTCAESSCFVPIQGACCVGFPNVCTITSQEACEGDFGLGTYYGDGTTCDCPQVECPELNEVGACCTGGTIVTCLDGVAEEFCFGTFLGKGTECARETCP